MDSDLPENSLGGPRWSAHCTKAASQEVERGNAKMSTWSKMEKTKRSHDIYTYGLAEFVGRGAEHGPAPLPTHKHRQAKPGGGENTRNHTATEPPKDECEELSGWPDLTPNFQSVLVS